METMKETMNSFLNNQNDQQYQNVGVGGMTGEIQGREGVTSQPRTSDDFFGQMSPPESNNVVQRGDIASGGAEEGMAENI